MDFEGLDGGAEKICTNGMAQEKGVYDSSSLYLHCKLDDLHSLSSLLLHVLSACTLLLKELWE